MDTEDIYLIGVVSIVMLINVVCLASWGWHRKKEKKWAEVDRILYSKANLAKRLFIVGLTSSCMVISISLLIYSLRYPEQSMMKQSLTISALILFAIYSLHQIWEWKTRKRRKQKEDELIMYAMNLQIKEKNESSQKEG